MIARRMGARAAGARSGFTLVEMLLAVSIFTTIAAAVYLSFSTGLEARSRIESASGELQRARFALDVIAGDLGSPERIEPGALRGGESVLRLAVLGPLRGGGEGESVEYRVAPQGDGSPALFRRMTVGEDVVSESRLIGGVELFEISYFASEKAGAGTWRSEWDAQGLPYAVRIELRTLRGGEYRRLIPLSRSWLRPPPEAEAESAG